jgi:hypothetical protein
MRLFDRRWRRGRFIRPNALFAGIACSFLACCLAGRAGSRHNLFENFERFHTYINPSSCFCPTASAVQALGRAKLPADKIAVVVGGNSVLYGWGQSDADLWSRKLQDRLGDDYRVLNLATCGSRPHEFGAIGAEILSGDHPRLILVTNVIEVAGYQCIPDGVEYAYFFWDAWCKGLAPRDPERDEAIANVPADSPGSARRGETKVRACLNSWLWFDDLWNGVAYSYVGTVWNRNMPQTWYLPRRGVAGEEQRSLPFESRYPPGAMDTALNNLRTFRANGGCRKDPEGHWVEDPAAPAWEKVRSGACRCFPEPFRKRTLIVVSSFSPYYVDRLPPDDRDLYHAQCRLTAGKLEGAGFAALDMGGDFTAEDFNDNIHLADTGGARLADKVAVRVRRLAAELGYARGGEGEK